MPVYDIITRLKIDQKVRRNKKEAAAECTHRGMPK
jgi:hypothetical protein